jgi:hypothetical protein
MSLHLTLFEDVHLMPCAKLPLGPKGFRMHIHSVKYGKGPRMSLPLAACICWILEEAYSASFAQWHPVWLQIARRP